MRRLHKELLLQLGLCEVRVLLKVECQVVAEVLLMQVQGNILQIAQNRSVLLINVRRHVFNSAHCLEPEAAHATLGVLDVLNIAEADLNLREGLLVFEDLSALIKLLDEFLVQSSCISFE
ncbi:MAG: hypothetical protein ACK56F_07920, partial [bacterium]